mmetsp:Transcript_16687/g.20041  ORF Transcript_16687/g.20041 Transcript_16687/m.20041 type:complete len:318 (-) Transcript_16687:102-1055(-)
MVRNSRNVSHSCDSWARLQHGSNGSIDILLRDGIIRTSHIRSTKCTRFQYGRRHSRGKSLTSIVQRKEGLCLGKTLGTFDDICGYGCGEGRAQCVHNSRSTSTIRGSVHTYKSRGCETSSTLKREALLDNLPKRSSRSRKSKSHVGISSRGSRDTGFTTDKGRGGGGICISSGSIRKSLFDSRDKCRMIGNTGGSKDSPVETVATGTEGLNGGSRSIGGVVGTSHGRLTTKGSRKDTFGQDNMSIGVGFGNFDTGKTFGIPHIPLFEGAFHTQERHKVDRLIRGSRVSNGSSRTSSGRKRSRTRVFKGTQDQRRRGT